ncbi:hypothetical protein SUGI_0921350 [Cryptomeria japonica]|nr:hypothetical protein SUGI_0921350 [Cryptomeria japonica]
MQQWFPNFNPVPLDPYDRTIWITIYNLLIEYWVEGSLEKIGRTLGALLEIDEDLVEKDSYLYAGLCTATVKWVPPKICLLFEGRRWIQLVEIEDTKKYCMSCGNESHFEKDCGANFRPHKKWNPKERNHKTVMKGVKPLILTVGPGKEEIETKEVEANKGNSDGTAKTTTRVISCSSKMKC